MATIQLPPWLQISPDQFTQAAIAGGEQGYRAAAEAGSLAQRGLLGAAQLAQEAASRAAEIRVRREQINAELARNAANVAAARYNAALDFNQAQNALTFAREREANAVAQQGVENQLNRDTLEAQTGVAMAKATSPTQFAPSDIGKLLQERQAALAAGDKASANLYDQRIKKLLEGEAKGLELSAPFGPGAAVSALTSPPRVSGPQPLVSEFLRTNTPAIPSAPVGGSTNLWEQFNAWRK